MPITPYTPPVLAGFNASPPPDDGSQTEANKVEWAKHINKIGAPLRAYIDAINAQCNSGFSAVMLEDWQIFTTTATIAEADAHNGILMTASGRVNYPDPAGLENGWHNLIYNGATGRVQLEATATNGFRRISDGLSASGHTMFPGEMVKVWNTATQYLIQTSRQQVYLGNAYSFEGNLVTATALIPADDTIPQATEGGQVLAVSFAPSEVGNLLAVHGQFYLSATAGTTIAAAAFATNVLGTQDAIAAGINNLGIVNGIVMIDFHSWVTSTATAVHTFTARIGANAGNVYLNGVQGSRRFGGVLRSWMEVTEYEL